MTIPCLVSLNCVRQLPHHDVGLLGMATSGFHEVGLTLDICDEIDHSSAGSN